MDKLIQNINVPLAQLSSIIALVCILALIIGLIKAASAFGKYWYRTRPKND